MRNTTSAPLHISVTDWCIPHAFTWVGPPPATYAWVRGWVFTVPRRFFAHVTYVYRILHEVWTVPRRSFARVAYVYLIPQKVWTI